MSRALIVLAKAPLPGFAKTRLQRETGIASADVARLAEAFVRDTLAVCAATEGARTLVCHAPPESADWFRAIAPGAGLAAQVDGDLGARMRAAFDRAFAGGATRAVMIGTDAPHLGADTVEAAFAALERADCVLAPAEDGGYVLIGLRRACPGILAGIAWSTSRVLEQTLERARELGVRCELLPAEFDVDGAADLERLARLVAAEPERCPHTARVLGSLAARGRADVEREAGPIERALLEDHRRLDALLARAIDAEPFDAGSFGAFRAELLRHIAVEERIVMAEARRIDPALAAPALALRVEHGAMAILLVPTPDRALALELRELIAGHMALEEGPDGVHARCERALRDHALDVVARMRAYPSVRTAAYLDVPGRPRTARAALEAMARRGGPRRASDEATDEATDPEPPA